MPTLSSSGTAQPKKQFDNPMHDSAVEGAAGSSRQAERELAPADSATSPAPIKAKAKANPRLVEIGDVVVDMNAKYDVGTQEWYLQQRRAELETQGVVRIKDEDEDDGTVDMSCGAFVKKLWKTLSSGSNIAAGLASALHVNIYLLALGLLLSSPYMGIMTIVRLAIVGTVVQQTFTTIFGSFRNFAISNCDTIPAAIFVVIVQVQ